MKYFIFLILLGCTKTTDPSPTFCYTCTTTVTLTGNIVSKESIDKCGLTEAQSVTFYQQLIADKKNLGPNYIIGSTCVKK